MGGLTPEIVVDAARPEEHPLHSRFEWDDSIAAEKWRREQASELIRSVKITYANARGIEKSVRAYVAVRGDTYGSTGYVPTEEALSDPFTRALLLREFEREWKTFKAKYDCLAEFASVIARDAAWTA